MQRATGLRSPADGRSACAPVRRWFLPAVAAACVLAQSLLGAAWPAAAQQPAAEGLLDEYELKAVFLYTFGRYVEWPSKAFADTSSPFVIGILGEDAFSGALDKIAAKKTIHGRHIVIRRFASLEEYRAPCHILFVSRSLAPDQQAAVFDKTRSAPVFVVGESPGFAKQGAAANFVVEGDRIRFEINAAAARQAQLSMDAKLLNLGIPVSAPRQTAAD
jgi:hypothetical protein